MSHRDVQEIVTSVEEAESIGCDAVAYSIYIGVDEEPEMLKHLPQVKEKCYELGLPLLGIVYPRGKNSKNLDAIRYAARLG